ncbi:MAG: sulfatase-like hydrolase/transferase, partial [Bacteroidota bacterium]|nr:sulfatase-like hydrolase/transferase [Bacteroidota bacterium]
MSSRILISLILLGSLSNCNQTALPKIPPNVILILVDDLGYSDLGAYGSEVATPNIDRMAFNGVRFTNAYNTSKCF